MQFWNLSQLQNKSFKNLRDLIEIKNEPINDQNYFSDSESTISSSMNVKRRIKNSYLRKPLRFSSWNQLINHIEFNTITLIQNQKWFTQPKNTRFHQNLYRCTSLIQNTLVGAAQKWFSVLPIEIITYWKLFTQKILKIFDSESDEQQQRILCNEVPRLPNKTTK